jgi:hypothetical protein
MRYLIFLSFLIVGCGTQSKIKKELSYVQGLNLKYNSIAEPTIVTLPGEKIYIEVPGLPDYKTEKIIIKEGKMAVDVPEKKINVDSLLLESVVYKSLLLKLREFELRTELIEKENVVLKSKIASKNKQLNVFWGITGILLAAGVIYLFFKIKLGGFSLLKIFK